MHYFSGRLKTICQNACKASLIILLVNVVYADEYRNDQVTLPFISSSDHENRCTTLQEDVEYRFEKYFENYEFASWNADRSENEIKEEFSKLNAMRRQIWFTNGNDQQNWREDFCPCQELMKEELIRAPNCIAFDYNKINNFYNGSLIEENGIRFLALEAPMDCNLTRFFDVLLETNASMLVCLTPAQDGIEQCTPYWEEHLNGNEQIVIPQSLNFPTVSPKSIDYITTNEWNDCSPAMANVLLNLVLKAKSLYDPSRGPIAVQCIGGVARAGTFIAAYCLVHEIDAQLAAGIPVNELNISIERSVARLSLQRYYMVACAPQYLNLYRLVQAYLDIKQK